MKKKVLFIIMLLFVGITKVHADENEYIKYIDNPGYTIDLEAETGDSGSNLIMTVKGISDTTAKYAAVFTNNKSNINLETNENGCNALKTETVGLNGLIFIEASTGHISVSNDWYLLKEGYTDVFIVKRTVDENFKGFCEIINEPISITRPELPSLGNRYRVFFFEDKMNMSLFPLFPYDRLTSHERVGSHKLNVKIGLINDNNILKKLAKNSSDAYTSLLDYAKNNSGTNFVIDDVDNYEKSIDKINVVNGKYYFIYTAYDNSDNVYRNLEDVAVTMGEYDRLVNKVVYGEFDQTDPLWEAFVDKFKNGDILKEGKETSGYTFDITYTDDKLTIITRGKDASNEDFTNETIFTYNNGIVSHIAATNDIGKQIDGLILVPNAVEAFAKVKNYNLDKLTNWLDEHPNATLQNDGIEYKVIKVESNENGVNSTLDGLLSELKVDLKNGIITFENTEPVTTPTTTTKVVQNPKTGIDLKTGLLLLIISSGIMGYYITEKKNKFPQA